MNCAYILQNTHLKKKKKKAACCIFCSLSFPYSSICVISEFITLIILTRGKNPMIMFDT